MNAKPEWKCSDYVFGWFLFGLYALALTIGVVFCVPFYLACNALKRS